MSNEFYMKGKEVGLGSSDGKFDTVYINIQDWNEIQKKLQALEIMKIKLGIEKEDFFYDDVLGYMFVGNVVSKEEFELLKEVLS